MFDGRLVQPLMNAVVARESLRSRADHVWWLYLDTDEFPEGPSGLTIREYLGRWTVASGWSGRAMSTISRPASPNTSRDSTRSISSRCASSSSRRGGPHVREVIGSIRCSASIGTDTSC